VRSRADQRLAIAVLQEWADLAWKLPRERKAVALQVGWAPYDVKEDEGKDAECDTADSIPDVTLWMFSSLHMTR
jgi:hypothetical protein